MARILVETSYDPPMDQALWDELLERSLPCLTDRNITWHKTYLSRDRRRSICLLDATDADAVRAAYQRGNVPYDNIWSADLLDSLPVTI